MAVPSELSGARRLHMTIPALVLALLGLATHSYSAPYEIPLGFLIPSVSNDSAITPQLALEWRSAASVALRVLQSRYKFRVVPFYADSGCNRSSAKEAAKLLVEEYNVVGVVGPACSESVIGANEIFKAKGVPFISFAATADALSNRKNFPTFYRTVYSDNFQSVAIAKVATLLKMKAFYIFHTDDVYGSGMNALLIGHLPVNSTKSVSVVPTLTDDYTSSFKSIGLSKAKLKNQTLVIFAVSPRVAKGLFKTALSLGYIGKKSPFIYLGTDGVTAFDLIGSGENLTALSTVLQGQIGLSPYYTNLQKSSHLVNFTNFWFNQSYKDFPGLVTYPLSDQRVNRTRSYVEHLIDATYVMHEIFQYITTKYRKNVTPIRIIRVLNHLSKTLKFNGCTGLIQFNNETGTRRENVEGGSTYKVVTYRKNTWKNVALWVRSNSKKFTIPDGKYIRPQNVTPYTIPLSFLAAPSVSYIDINFNITFDEPTPSPPPSSPPSPPPLLLSPPPTTVESKSSGGAGVNKGRVVGFIFLALVLTAIAIVGLVWYYKRRKAYLEQPFVRML